MDKKAGRWFKQKYLGQKGDCLRACICMILGISDEGVPNFCVAPEGKTQEEWSEEWWDFTKEWLRLRGLSLVEMMYKGPTTYPADGQLCIVTGRSPRGKFDHSAVGRVEGGKVRVIFDPHPDVDVKGDDNSEWCSFDGGIRVVGFLVPLDPSCLIDKSSHSDSL